MSPDELHLPLEISNPNRDLEKAMARAHSSQYTRKHPLICDALTTIITDTKMLTKTPILPILAALRNAQRPQPSPNMKLQASFLKRPKEDRQK